MVEHLTLLGSPILSTEPHSPWRFGSAGGLPNVDVGLVGKCRPFAAGCLRKRQGVRSSKDIKRFHTGWWFQPLLKNMKVSWDHYSQ